MYRSSKRTYPSRKENRSRIYAGDVFKSVKDTSSLFNALSSNNLKKYRKDETPKVSNTRLKNTKKKKTSKIKSPLMLKLLSNLSPENLRVKHNSPISTFDRLLQDANDPFNQLLGDNFQNGVHHLPLDPKLNLSSDSSNYASAEEKSERHLISSSNVPLEKDKKPRKSKPRTKKKDNIFCTSSNKENSSTFNHSLNIAPVKNYSSDTSKLLADFKKQINSLSNSNISDILNLTKDGVNKPKSILKKGDTSMPGEVPVNILGSLKIIPENDCLTPARNKKKSNGYIKNILISSTPCARSTIPLDSSEHELSAILSDLSIRIDNEHPVNILKDIPPQNMSIQNRSKSFKIIDESINDFLVEYDAESPEHIQISMNKSDAVENKTDLDVSFVSDDESGFIGFTPMKMLHNPVLTNLRNDFESGKCSPDLFDSCGELSCIDDKIDDKQSQQYIVINDETYDAEYLSKLQMVPKIILKILPLSIEMKKVKTPDGSCHSIENETAVSDENVSKKSLISSHSECDMSSPKNPINDSKLTQKVAKVVLERMAHAEICDSSNNINQTCDGDEIVQSSKNLSRNENSLNKLSITNESDTQSCGNSTGSVYRSLNDDSKLEIQPIVCIERISIDKLVDEEENKLDEERKSDIYKSLESNKSISTECNNSNIYNSIDKTDSYTSLAENTFEHNALAVEENLDESIHDIPPRDAFITRRKTRVCFVESLPDINESDENTIIEKSFTLDINNSYCNTEAVEVSMKAATSNNDNDHGSTIMDSFIPKVATNDSNYIRESVVSRRPSFYLQPGKKWERSLRYAKLLNLANDTANHSVLDSFNFSSHNMTVTKGRNFRKSISAVCDLQTKIDNGIFSNHNQTQNLHEKTLTHHRCQTIIYDDTFLPDENDESVRHSFDRLLSDSCNESEVSLARLSLSESDRGQVLLDKSQAQADTRWSSNARDTVLRRCRQTHPLPFDECYPDQKLQNCRKIGEGAYGEVFLYKNRDEPTRPIVMKVIPIEGTLMVNNDHQKKFHEIISEIVIAMELSELRKNKTNCTYGFNEVRSVRCVKGRYPERLLELWELYDEQKGSENDCPNVFGPSQLYVVLELANGGTDLEAYRFTGAHESYSLFFQIALTLAIAEEAFQFEHRDLHWGNVLINKTCDEVIDFTLRGNKYSVPSCGIVGNIIDFTLSRITFPRAGVTIFNDLSKDPELFEAEGGDYQFEVYKLMKKNNGDNWKDFEPRSNIFWLHYVLLKMINDLRYEKTKTKQHKSHIAKLRELEKNILKYESCIDFVTSNNFDSSCM